MSQPEDLDLSLHQDFDRRWRIAEYGIIAALSIVCLAALSGALGSGPLSRATESVQGPAARTLSYERILRNHGSSWMRIKLNDGFSGLVDVHLDSTLANSVAIETVMPRPLAARVSTDGITYTFDVRTAEDASLSFRLAPYRIGSIRTVVTVGGARITITQIVLP
jgi:hypothetical protein